MPRRQTDEPHALSEPQRQLAALLADPGEDHADKACAALLGVSASTIARWKKLPALIERVRELVRAQTDERMPKVWESILRRAEEGDIAAAKLLLTVRGEMKEKKEEAAAPPPPVVNLIISDAGEPEKTVQTRITGKTGGR